MTGVNSGDHHDLENEALQTSQKANAESIQARAYKSFVQQGIEKEGIGFINRISSLPDSDTDYKNEFQGYLDGKEEFLSLGEDFKEQMSLGKVKGLIASELVKIKLHRTTFKKFVLGAYDIDADRYNAEIASKVEGLEVAEIKEMHKDLEKTEDFFKSSGISVPTRRDIKSFLNDLNIEQRISNIKPNNRKDRVIAEVSSMRETLDINSSQFPNNLSVLLGYLCEEEGILEKNEKKELIQKLIPSISLAQAKKAGLVSQKEIESFLKQYMKDEGIDSSHHASILSRLEQQLDSIEFPTSDLDLSKAGNIQKIGKSQYFSDFSKNIQHVYHEVNKNGPESFSALKDEMQDKFSEKITGLDNFKTGNVLELQVSEGSGVRSEYYEIYATESQSAPHNKVFLINRGGKGVYHPHQDAKMEHKFYSDFLDLVGFNSVQKVSFYSKLDMEQRVASGELSEDEGNFQYKSEQDKEGRYTRHKNYLEQEFEKKGWMNPGDNLEDTISSLNEGQKSEFSDKIEAFESALNANIHNLLKEIDQSDKKGAKFGLEAGTTFSIEGNKEQYTIQKIVEEGDSGEITIERIGGEIEKVDFYQFLETFKQKKCKRQAKILDASNIIDAVNDDEALWEGIEYKSNNLVTTGKDGKEYTCDYLVAGDKSDTFWREYNTLKIDSISGNTATVHLGKMEKLDPKKDKTKGVKYVTARNTITVSIGILTAWIKNARLGAKNTVLENAQEAETPDEPKMKKGLWNNYINNFYSIPTLLSVGKKYFEMWEEYLKEGNDMQVAKLVNKIPVLSKEQRAAMTMMLETNQKKSMDEYIEKLKILDSGEATALIADWIVDMNTSEAQKEAGLFYMCEKYGVLYEKGPLMKHKGSWIWYTTLGGKVGDELFREEEAKAKKLGIQFTEEDLVYVLIARQGKGKLKPKRRGKLYKEYEAIMGKGREAEVEKGKKDASKKRTYEQREDFAIDELAGGGWPNAIGAMEEAVGKGADGSVSRLNCIPFVMMVSGAADTFFQQSADAFKNGLIASQFFIGKQEHIDVYKKTVIELAKDIENKLGGQYEGMGSAFSDLIERGIGKDSKGKRKKLNETERVEYAYELFKNEKWGDTLSRALLQLNTRLTDKEAEFETWIEDNQDNHIYKSYQGLFKAGLGSTKDHKFKSEDELKDGLSSEGGPGTGGVTGWYPEEIAKHFLQQQSGGVGFRNQDLGGLYWKEITDQIDATAANEHTSEEYKRQRIARTLKGLMDGLAFSYGQRDGVLQSILENQGHVFYGRFKQWGVKADDWNKGDTKFSDGSFIRGNDIINRYIDNILSGSRYSGDTPGSENSFQIGNITNAVSNKAAAQLGADNIYDE